MVDVVGLRFVTEGEGALINAIQRVDKAQQALGQTSRALEAAQKRGAATDREVIAAYLALERAGMSYKDVLQGVDQDQRMAAQTAQVYTNQLLGIDQGFKSARESAAAFSAAFGDSSRIAAAARETQKLYETLLGIDQPFRAAADSAAVFVSKLREQETAMATAARQAQQFYKTLLTIDQPYKSAADSADIFVDAQQRAAASYNQLRAAINPAFAAQTRMRQVHATVREALKQEVITRQQAAQMLVAYRTQLQLTNTTLSVNGDAHTFASGRMNGTAMAIQQTGYQVGDFLVQVQGGTNVMVAFGQQATQLVGILPMFSQQLGVSVGRLIAVSAGLGIAIPLVTAIGAYFMRTGQQARSFGDTLGDLEKAMNASVEVASNFRDVGSDSFKTVKAEAVAFLQVLREARAEQMQIALASVIEGTGVGAELSTLEAGLAAQAAAEAMSGIEQSAEAAARATEDWRSSLGLTYIQLAQLDGILNSIGGKTRDDIVASFFAAVQRMETLGLQTDGVKRLIDEMATSLGIVDDAFVEVERSAAGTHDILRMIVGVNLADGFMSAADAVSTMNSRLNITLGRIRGIMSAIGSIGFDIVATKAETAALTAGASEGQAAIEGQMARRGAELADLPTAMRNAVILAERKAREDLLAAQTAREAALPGDAGGGAGGGGAAELATLTSITEAMLVRIERERELLGLTGEARRAKELQLQIEEQLRQSGQVATEEAIQNAAREIAAREAVNETFRQQQSEMERIGKLLESSMTDAFMSIVDGTKSAEDAFKDMARLIIAELFKVLVVQQLVGQVGTATTPGSGIAGFVGKAISGVLGNANGNAFMGGNVIPFARGGVVGSPTMFPMAGGRTGLMGEAGPEAIMPLKRGKDGKLGVQAAGGGNVSIVQNFSVSANGDESVKRIVAQQVPAIAEATKAAVLDARQRGGKMRATFR
jgi:hypothetical protein